MSTALLHDRSYLAHSESEQYKLPDSKSQAGLGRAEVCVWSPTKLKGCVLQRLAERKIVSNLTILTLEQVLISMCRNFKAINFVSIPKHNGECVSLSLHVRHICARSKGLFFFIIFTLPGIVAHFAGYLKWRIWRSKMYFSSLK